MPLWVNVSGSSRTYWRLKMKVSEASAAHNRLTTTAADKVLVFTDFMGEAVAAKGRRRERRRGKMWFSDSTADGKT